MCSSDLSGQASLSATNCPDSFTVSKLVKYEEDTKFKILLMKCYMKWLVGTKMTTFCSSTSVHLANLKRMKGSRVMERSASSLCMPLCEAQRNPLFHNWLQFHYGRYKHHPSLQYISKSLSVDLFWHIFELLLVHTLQNLSFEYLHTELSDSHQIFTAG